MRKLLCSLIAFTFVAAGCQIGSLSPLYKPGDLSRDDRLEGCWRIVDDAKGEKDGSESSGIRITNDEHGFYRIEFLEIAGERGTVHGPEPSGGSLAGECLRLGLVKLADACFADVCLHPSGMRRGEAFALFALPVHYQFKLDIRQDRLSLRALDEEWLGDWLAAHPAELAYVRLHGEYVLPPFGAHPDHELGERVVLTAPTEQVQKFLRENAANERAWSEHSMVLERIEPTRAGEESPGIKP